MSEQRLGTILLRPSAEHKAVIIRTNSGIPDFGRQTVHFTRRQALVWILNVAECVPSSVACLHFNIIVKFKLLLMAAPGLHFSGSQKSTGCAPEVSLWQDRQTGEAPLVKWQQCCPTRSSTACWVTLGRHIPPSVHLCCLG